MSEYIYDCGKDPIITTYTHNGEVHSYTSIHPIQRETITRCKDCRYYREKHSLCAGFGHEWNGELVQVEPDGFCKWAEREER